MAQAVGQLTSHERVREEGLLCKVICPEKLECLEMWLTHTIVSAVMGAAV